LEGSRVSPAASHWTGTPGGRRPRFSKVSVPSALEALDGHGVQAGERGVPQKSEPSPACQRDPFSIHPDLQGRSMFMIMIIRR
jgi:hypothetical protein